MTELAIGAINATNVVELTALTAGNTHVAAGHMPVAANLHLILTTVQ